MREFQSCFGPWMERFISCRKASERWNEISYEPNLKRFDKYCSEFYPNQKQLTQEMVDSWCKQRETETNNSCLSRIYVVVDFIRYLREREFITIENPIVPKCEKRNYIPHAFTENELEKFFIACDSIKPYHFRNSSEISRKYTVPVFFRLLYSSGIRTVEARKLRVGNVDLIHGIINIQYSKGYDQHYVVLHDSMTELIRQYDVAIGNLYPNRVYFFPADKMTCHSRDWVIWNFRQMWDKVNKASATAYVFRHNYAIKNINRWIDKGFDFDDKLLYLSKSMGHSNVEHTTKYYYAIVPGMSDILKEKTEEGFNLMVPEVVDDEIEF